MRFKLLCLLVGAIGFSLLGLLALPGHARDYPPSHSDQKGMATYPRKTGQPEGRLRPEFPPISPYRELYYFPHAAPTNPPSDKVRDITLYDDVYSPSIQYITSGMTVRWTNRGKHHHTVTSDWMWESGELKSGESFSLTFTRKGTYYYYCRMHSKYMRGKVVVYY
jgi:plastocyanin